MSKKSFKPTKSLTKFSPYARWFPKNSIYCEPHEVNELHYYYCNELSVKNIFPKINWHFEKRFTATLGQAEFWEDDDTGEMQYLIRYATRFWPLMQPAGRRNLVAHEICHLAVEQLFGHGKVDRGMQVTDHGYHWKLLMRKCGEDPNFDIGC